MKKTGLIALLLALLLVLTGCQSANECSAWAAFPIR